MNVVRKTARSTILMASLLQHLTKSFPQPLDGVFQGAAEMSSLERLIHGAICARAANAKGGSANGGKPSNIVRGNLVL